MSDQVHVAQHSWGISPEGTTADAYTLSNGQLTLEVLSFGARVVTLLAPDRDGNVASVVLGYPALEPYLTDTAFLGCTVGRYANRIAYGQFTLEGKAYELDRNDGANTLHGGSDGLWHRNWTSQVLLDGVEFSLVSPSGDQGFPGRVEVHARYRLRGNTVLLEYEATTDQQTILNLTNHAYFNLAGEGSATILDHELQIHADEFTPIDDSAIPTGGNSSVQGTPFDFRELHRVGERIHAADSQLANGKGYDHNLVLRRGADLRQAATAVHPGSGRRLEIATTEPGIQFYSGNYLDGTTTGRSGQSYGWRSAFCLETQHFPNSPNQPDFPSTVLRPGDLFRSTTTWTLTAE